MSRRRPDPREVRVFDPRKTERREWEAETAVRIERNGHLTYVEFDDGHREWLAPHEIEE